MRDTQSPFIQGRNIFEEWMKASEVVEAMKQIGKEVVFKFDFENAYDCVD